MRTVARALVGIAVVAACASCGDRVNGTLFVVRVGLQGLAPGGDVDRIQLVATPAAGAAATQTIDVDATTSLPVQFALVPKGARDQPFTIVATGQKGGQAVVAVTASVAFTPDAARALSLVLQRGCSALATPPACPAAQTCRNATCVDPASFAGEVVAYDPNGGGGGAAGGAGGAAGGGAGGNRDAGAPDARPDAGPTPLMGSWVAVDAKVPPTVTLTALSVLGPNDVFAVGSDAAGAIGRAFHWNGTEFTAIELPLVTPPLNGVWAFAPDDVWAVGVGGTVLHGDRKTLTNVASQTKATLSGIAGTSANDFWLAGTNGTLLRALNGAISPFASPVMDIDLVGVATPAADDAWAVGGDGTVLRFGGTWMRIDHGQTRNVLYAVWAVARDDVWITGERIALHWDGRALTSRPTTLAGGLGVWGRAADDVWAVGRPQAGASPISHYDGNAWTAVPSPFTGTLQSVRGSGAANVWAVGNMGTVLRFVPNK